MVRLVAITVSAILLGVAVLTCCQPVAASSSANRPHGFVSTRERRISLMSSSVRPLRSHSPSRFKRSRRTTSRSAALTESTRPRSLIWSAMIYFCFGSKKRRKVMSAMTAASPGTGHQPNCDRVPAAILGLALMRSPALAGLAKGNRSLKRGAAVIAHTSNRLCRYANRYRPSCVPYRSIPSASR